MITTDKIKDSVFVERLEAFANTNVVAKSIVAIIVWSLALIPTWLYLIARWLLEPVGFWQELAILVIAGIAIGWLQAILIIFGGAITIAIILEN